MRPELLKFKVCFVAFVAYALWLMPYALCLMPYALCLMPYALCLMPYALCLMPYGFMRNRTRRFRSTLLLFQIWRRFRWVVRLSHEFFRGRKLYYPGRSGRSVPRAMPGY